MRPTIIMLEACPEDESKAVEQRWIETLSRSGKLLNMIAPGKGKKRVGKDRVRLAFWMDQTDRDLCASAASLDGERLDDWGRVRLIDIARERLTKLIP
jgi:hypothetical protein